MMVRTILCQTVSKPKVFSDEYEPTACCCTPNGLILIASNYGNIHLYMATGRSPNSRINYKFQIGGVATKLVYCNYGNYIATIESKIHEFRSGVNAKQLTYQARVYLNWMTQPADAKYLTQHRAGYSNESFNLETYVGKYLVIDIPVRSSVTDISCSDTDGNIALAAQTKIFLYAYRKREIDFTASEENGYVVDFEILMVVDAGFQVSQIALYDNYIAFASVNEIRVIQVSFESKESICQAEDVSEMMDVTQPSVSSEKTGHCALCQSKADENFVLWNIEQGCSQSLDNLEHETITLPKRKPTSTSHSNATYVIEKSLVKFDEINREAIYVDHGQTAKEILGPMESIKGHPVTVNSGTTISNNDSEATQDCINHVTLLYRRFPYSEPDASSQNAGVHSLQWIPIYAENVSGAQSGKATPLQYLASTELGFVASPKEANLISLGFFFSTARKGYLYDMVNTPKPLSEYDFTEDCISASLSHSMLHVITRNGLETYTTRIYPSAAQTASASIREDLCLSPRFQHEDKFRERAWSSLSFSSGSEIDTRSQTGDGYRDFSDDGFTENQGNDDMIPTEGHYFKVQPEPKTYSPKKTKSKISLRRRKKKENAKNQKFFDEEKAENEPFASGIFGIVNAKEEQMRSQTRYQYNDLIKPCPSTTIEICLIGMYSLRGFTYIGTSDRHVILLQKSLDTKGKRGSHVKDTVVPWNVYVFEKVPTIEICKEIMSLIDGSEFANPSVFHQLLSEAHLCLRSSMTSDTNSDRLDSLRGSIRRSAVRIGDFLSRCNTNFEHNMAKEYYKMAGIKLDQVLLRLSKRDIDENIAHKYGAGMIYYLNEQIFYEGDGDIDLPEVLVNHILKVYSTVAPELLSKVILKSRLKHISPEGAAALLEKFLHEEKDSSHYKLSDFDYVTLAILRLQIGEPTQAEHMLKMLSNSTIIQAISPYPELIWLDTGKLSHLGQLLRRHFSATFSELLALFHCSGLISFEKSLSVFELNKNESSTSTSLIPKACDYLEALLNDDKMKESFPEIMEHLVHLYMSKLEETPQGDLLQIPHSHVPKGNGQFVTRHDWLDKLPPFSGEPPSPQDCILRKQRKSLGQISRSSLTTPESSPMGSLTSSNSLDMEHGCCCCCCNSVLLKLQSLLSSSSKPSSMCEKLLNFTAEKHFPGQDSIKLLCLPAANQVTEAVQLVIQQYPSIMFQYAKDIFHNNKEEWKIFLNHLLKALRENLYEQWNKETYLDALRGTLLKLARLCKPAEFLSVLPKDGSSRFFLPFIQECHQMHMSIILRKDIIQIYNQGV